MVARKRAVASDALLVQIPLAGPLVSADAVGLTPTSVATDQELSL
jgi:hypothetical protein